MTFQERDEFPAQCGGEGSAIVQVIPTSRMPTLSPVQQSGPLAVDAQRWPAGCCSPSEIRGTSLGDDVVTDQLVPNGGVPVVANTPEMIGEQQSGQCCVGAHTSSAGCCIEIRDVVSGEGSAMVEVMPIPPLLPLSNTPGASGGDGSAMVLVMPKEASPAVVVTASGQEVRLRVRPPRIDPGPARGGGGAKVPLVPRPGVPATAEELQETLDTIREKWKGRGYLIQQKVGTELRAQAYCRALCLGDRGEAQKLYEAVLKRKKHPLFRQAFPIVTAVLKTNESLEETIHQMDLSLIKLAKKLPAAKFVMASKGFGLLTFAGIIGEAGNLSNYPNPDKLKKRMSIAVHTDGKRQRKIAGLSQEELLKVGYVPRRRSLLWNFGGHLIKAMGPPRKIYDDRKPLEMAKCELIAADPVRRKEFSRSEQEGKSTYSAKAHAHNRAKRYMEQQMLIALWAAWHIDCGSNSARLPPGTDPFQTVE